MRRRPMFGDDLEVRVATRPIGVLVPKYDEGIVTLNRFHGDLTLSSRSLLCRRGV